MASSLFHTLGIGAESLFTSRQGVDTSGHNIANAQTEGFTRQRVEVGQRNPSDNRGHIMGNGVFVKTIRRVHDKYLEKHLNEANQMNGETESRLEHMNQLQAIYSPELNATVADEISAFFTSLNDMAIEPEDLGIRTAVKESAENLVTAFRRVDSSLKDNGQDINRRISGEIEEINTILNKLGEINTSVATLEISSEARIANDLRDQQDTLIATLNKKMDIASYRDELGMVTVRGPSETLLVDRGFAAKIEQHQRPGPEAYFDLVVTDANEGIHKNITSKITTGKLHALVDLRDRYIPEMLHSNNQLAHTIASEVNAIHRKGFGMEDYSESTGRNFFDIPDDLEQAGMKIEIDDAIVFDVAAISGSISPNAPGDNVIINELLSLRGKKTMGGGLASFNEFYADFVGQLGIDSLKAEHMKQANEILLGELKSRKEAISGVSVDEEAMNLLKWQSNFTASSKVITTVDEMLETVLGLKR